jgi:hypothetical protein
MTTQMLSAFYVAAFCMPAASEYIPLLTYRVYVYYDVLPLLLYNMRRRTKVAAAWITCSD